MEQQQQRWSNSLTIKVVLAVLFLCCLIDMPYGYYQIVRLTGMFGFIILTFLEGHHRILIKVFWILSAVLINPIFKVSLDKSIWVIIDVIWSLILLWTAWTEYRGSSNKATRKKK